MGKQSAGCSGCLKYLLFIIIAIFIGVGIANIGLGGSDSGAVSGNAPLPPNTTGSIYYAQLSDTEKMIYNGLLDKVAQGELSCSFTDIDYDTCVEQVPRAVQALTYDHPEYFWLNGGSLTSGQYRLGNNRDSMTVELYHYEYWTYTMSPDKYRDTLEQKVDAVAAKAKAYKTPFEQIRYVHDYLVQNTIYDHEGLAEAEKTHHVASSEYIYSAYGCLINGRAVCAGYAKAFQLILTELGYECIYVVGDAGGPHAWNCITIDDQTYFVDVTWDDKDHVTEQGTMQYPNDAEYPYFCITSEQLARTHTVDESDFDIPDCTATAYNYYVYNDLLVEDYSRAAVDAAVSAQKGQQIISMQFTSAKELKEASNDLFDNNNWSRLSSLSSASKIRYYVNEDMLVLTLFR